MKIGLKPLRKLRFLSFRFWMLLLTFFVAGISNASHLVGGFLTYEWLGTNGTNTQYRVTLFVYRDCAKDGTNEEVPFDDDLNLCVYKGDKKIHTTYVIKLLAKKKVQPVGNTNCPEIASACLEQGIYESTISLPNSNTGYHLKWERCCRNTQNNLRNQFGEAYQGQTYYGFIPPTNIKNSSPYFQDIPVPFICRNDTITIRNRALDPDGDSLSYKLVRPWQGADMNNPTLPTCPSTMTTPFAEVDYNTGYSATKPFGNAGIASIDAFNGLTTYMSTIAGRFAVAIEVTEWRNGVAISTVRLDLQILVINCSPNNKPTLEYTKGKRYWELELGEPICFDVKAVDAKDIDDVVTLKAYGDIITGSSSYTGPKATFNPTLPVAGKASITSQFCWNPGCSVNTDDTFRVIFEAFDDGCPSKFINQNVLIKYKPFSPKEKISGPNLACQNQNGVIYTVANRSYKNTLKWSVKGGTIIGSDTANTLVINWGNSDSGRVYLKVTNPFGCSIMADSFKVTLLPPPPKPKIEGEAFACLSISYLYKAYGTGKISFKIIGSKSISENLANQTVNVVWDEKFNGQRYIIAYQANSAGCLSDGDTLKITMTAAGKPVIKGPTNVCPNNDNIEYYVDSIEVLYTYEFFATNARKVTSPSKGRALINWGDVGPGRVMVIATNIFGCKDTGYFDVLMTHALLGQPPIGDSSLCELTANVPYKVNKISGEDYSWSISGGSISSGQNTDKITADWGTAGNAWVGVKSTGYDPINKRVCQSSLYKLNVILHPTPTANIFPDLQPEQCQQNNQFFTLVDFSALNGVDFGDSIDYQITPNTGLTLETISGVGKPKPGKLKISLNQFGTFTIKARIISKHGCPGPWDQTQITINPKPINTQLVGDSVICNPNVSNLGYVINGNAGSTFTWKLIGGNWANNPGTNNAGSVNWDSLAPLRNITVREISDKGCPGDSISWNIYYDNPWIESRLVTVSPPPDKDGKILVEYQLKNSPRPNGPVYIQRRPFNSGQFWNVGQGPINGTEFQDLDVKPDAFSYDYRAMILNQCGDTLYSPINTSILLTGQRTGPMSMSFTFTPYLGWAVEKYELYRELINKTGYELYQTYPGNTSDSFNNGEEHFGQKYRIKAYELGGSRVSWSNDILLYFDPVMFVPNAFTPDGKGTNDIFKPVISGVLDYQFRIYNRWGEKLAEFRNESEGWDGTYNGQNAPDGVYVYQISFKDYKEEIYQFSGTVQLLR